jgi:transposase
MTVNGAVDTEVFRAYVEQVLRPTLTSGDIVLMDNLAVHKVARTEETIRARGARLEYLPPHSPDRNPSEKYGAKIKPAFRRAKALTRAPVGAALQHAVPTMTASETEAGLAHCRYPVHSEVICSRVAPDPFLCGAGIGRATSTFSARPAGRGRPTRWTESADPPPGETVLVGRRLASTCPRR